MDSLLLLIQETERSTISQPHAAEKESQWSTEPLGREVEITVYPELSFQSRDSEPLERRAKPGY